METIESWLDSQIQDAENIYSHLRSYNKLDDSSVARLQVLKEVRQKLQELWGIE